jgi:hypothetical protein
VGLALFISLRASKDCKDLGDERALIQHYPNLSGLLVVFTLPDLRVRVMVLWAIEPWAFPLWPRPKASRFNGGRLFSLSPSTLFEDDKLSSQGSSSLCCQSLGGMGSYLVDPDRGDNETLFCGFGDCSRSQAAIHAPLRLKTREGIGTLFLLGKLC